MSAIRCWRVVAPLVMLSVVGCYNPDYRSGNLMCAATAPECPDEFSCIDGRCWKAGEAPNGDLTSSNTDGGSGDGGADGAVMICTPDSFACGGTAGSDLQRCASDGSSYMTLATCPAGMCSVGLGRCNFCEPGTVMCNGQQVTKCDAFGSMMGAVGAPCGTGTTCDPASGGRCDACAPNSVYCVGTNLRKCAADGQSSTLVDTCATPEICAMSGAGGCGSAFCNSGDIHCVGSQLQTCNAGRTAWMDVATCATAALCAISTSSACAAPACAVGQKNCSGTSLQTCNSGRTGFTTVDVCATSELCTASTGTTCTAPACNVGDKRCGTGTSSNTVQTCNSGRTGWTDVTTCTAPQTCGGSGTAGVCGGCSGTLSGPTMVSISTYCVDTTEVTTSQYQAFVTAAVSFAGQPAQCSFNTSWTVHSPTNGSCDFNGTAPANNPATCIDWCDAFAYCKWAGKRLCGKVGGGSADYSTPAATSSQWFNACSNANTTKLPYGNTYTRGVCNVYGASAVSLTAVQSFPSCKGLSANYSSIYDMTGNAAEWEDSCQSLSGNYYCHSRGGSVSVGTEDPTQFECDTGDAWPVDFTTPWQGFRCCAL